ncbi:YggS family pyridoxal phosphate-dependent enzyme [Actinotalea sp. AC32]|nr:YggS family pyridoxal phosphate-dependent enzyme [Actinotalea sp. AC32]
MARLGHVQDRVARAADAAGRPAASVRLMLAVKRQPEALVREAVLAGASLLGDNTVQELAAHAPGIADLGPELHLIGHLQSNKVNAALRWATCVQTVDSVGLAERLARRCATLGRDLDVMVQVNVSGEAAKHGVAPEGARALAEHVAGLDRLRLTGFMTVGALSDDDAVVRGGFRRLREVRDDVVGSGVPGTADATELSMGMSGDLESAVAEGATIVRVGSAVFGDRPARPAR